LDGRAGDCCADMTHFGINGRANVTSHRQREGGLVR
jgi:hypothetical protein